MMDFDEQLALYLKRAPREKLIELEIACRAALVDHPAPPVDAALVEEARRRYDKDGEVELDGPNETIVSRGDPQGAYVMAWVWVDDPE